MSASSGTGKSLPRSRLQPSGEYGARIAELIHLAGGRKSAASISGASADSLDRYVRGDRVPLDVAAALCKAAGRSMDWLSNGDLSDEVVSGRDTLAIPDLTLVPRLDIEVAAGHGAMSTLEDPVELLAFNTDWLRKRGINPKAAHVLTARGDSMEPTIRGGDVLLVDTSITQVEDNGIYIVRLGGLLMVKRVGVRFNGALRLISDNKERYEPEDISAERAVDLHVAGRVMWFGRSM